MDAEEATSTSYIMLLLRELAELDQVIDSIGR